MPQVECNAPIPLNDADTMLLCTDGIWGMINPHELSALLHAYTLEDAVRHLMDHAEFRGAHQGLAVGGQRCTVNLREQSDTVQGFGQALPFGFRSGRKMGRAGRFLQGRPRFTTLCSAGDPGLEPQENRSMNRRRFLHTTAAGARAGR